MTNSTVQVFTEKEFKGDTATINTSDFNFDTKTSKTIILITCLITLCIFAFAFYMCSRNDDMYDRYNDMYDRYNEFGQNTYIYRNKWMLMNGRGIYQ